MTRFIGQRATTGDKTRRLDRYTRRSVLQTVDCRDDVSVRARLGRKARR